MKNNQKPQHAKCKIFSILAPDFLQNSGNLLLVYKSKKLTFSWKISSIHSLRLSQVLGCAMLWKMSEERKVFSNHVFIQRINILICVGWNIDNIMYEMQLHMYSIKSHKSFIILKFIYFFIIIILKCNFFIIIYFLTVCPTKRHPFQN